LAESSGRPILPIGLFAATCLRSRGLIHPVWLGPGLIALTVIPRGASSSALDTVVADTDEFGRGTGDDDLILTKIGAIAEGAASAAFTGKAMAYGDDGRLAGAHGGELAA
jgi:hypothetical protein